MGYRVKHLLIGAALFMGTLSSALAGEKSQYSLFNPTPGHQMREMSTDRPDTVETPFTVDAGHIQFETNLFGYARSRPSADGTISHAYDLAATNIRVGLTNAVEFNAVWQPHGIVHTRQRNPFARSRESGIGGVDLRTKINLWGNDNFDETGSALALLPYVSLPVDRNNGISPDHVEGGLIIPLALKLSETFEFGFNGGARWIKSDTNAAYHTEYLASASLAYAWTDRFGTYYEVSTMFNVDDPRGSNVVVVGTGVTYAVTDNLQLDAGMNFGVTDASDRINPFIGFSQRF
ncbi:transporter [Hyphomicrobium methylovorum]|nr:transporter [Hyphomicrobium methylovorum]